VYGRDIRPVSRCIPDVSLGVSVSRVSSFLFMHIIFLMPMTYSVSRVLFVTVAPSITWCVRVLVCL